MQKKDMNVVETQGAMGIENKLKDSDIATADLIIFANDV